MSTRTLILGTAGHIDHGKTALVRALTGVDTDRLPQEKARGITIDIGFAGLDLDNCHLGIVDVPGHERFIKNMLAGASGIDIAMLVVAADDSVMPQTREHLAILKLLQIKHGIIVLTKCDLAEETWLDLVEDDIRNLVKGSFLIDAAIVRTSAINGSGIDELKDILSNVCSTVTQQSGDDYFRLAVDRSFIGQGVGTIITGTVNAGEISVGNSVEWLPACKQLRVRSLQSHGEDVQTASRGQRAAINLMGVHHTEIKRGHELTIPPGIFRPSRLLTVQLNVLPNSPFPIKHRSRLRLHIGTQEVMTIVRALEQNETQPGGSMIAQLVLAEPATAICGQPFVLRAESPLVTVGGGRVLQPVGSRIRRRDSHSIEHLVDFLSAELNKRIGTAYRFAGTRELTQSDLIRDTGVSIKDIEEITSVLIKQNLLVELDTGTGRKLVIHNDVLSELKNRVAKSLKRLHDLSPLESAIARPRLISSLKWLGNDSLLNAIVDLMIAEKTLVGDEMSVALADFKPKLSQAERVLMERVTGVYKQAEFMPPDVKELAQQVSEQEKKLRRILALCVETKQIVHLGGPLYMHSEHETELRKRMEDKLKSTSGLAMSEIRDLLNTSRKYALPLCDYLDRIGLTKREGDQRVLA